MEYEEEKEEDEDEDEGGSAKKKKKSKKSKKIKKIKEKTSSDEEEEEDDEEINVSEHSDDEDGSGDEDGDDNDEDGDSDDESGDEDEDGDSGDETEEEDEYIKAEKAYSIQTDPEDMTQKKFMKMSLHETLTTARVVFVNYLAEDCQYLLKKLMQLAELIFETMKVLIISMPAEATCFDTYYARRLCQLFNSFGGDLQIFFIKNDDKQDFINRVFKREKKKFTQVSAAKLTLSLSEGTMVYTWGGATKGKLGLS